MERDPDRAVPGGDGLRIWALLGPRTGDNNQVLALADAVLAQVPSATLSVHALRYNLLRLWPTRLGGPGRASLTRDSRIGLVPPWPDLVIGVGRRSVPVARWIRARSGGRARIVQIGRPRCRPERFDLVLTTAQYGVPAGPTVLELPVCLSRQTPAVLAEAARRWGGALRRFPPPRRVLLLGGTSWPYRLRAPTVEAACRELCAQAASEGGSVLAIASRRTGAGLTRRVRALLEGADVPAALVEGQGQENPYAGLLALAHSVSVTADSLSMIADAVATGRPVRLVEVEAAGPGGTWLRLMRRLRVGAEGQGGRLSRLAGRGWAWLVGRGFAGWPRDLWFAWRRLRREGLVGGPVPSPAGAPRPPVTAMAMARVMPLLGAGRAGGHDDDRPDPAHRDADGASRSPRPPPPA